MVVKRIDRFLDVNGDGTGNKNAIGDYSSTAQRFKLTNPTDSGRRMHLHRMIVQIRDSTDPSASEYGNLGAALTNGIHVRVRDANDNTLENLTDDEPIKTNADYARFCYDSVIDNFKGTGDAFVSVRWTLDKAGGPLILQPGQSFMVELSDSFVGINNHGFLLQGQYK
ncbi:MAG: hypothetical protein KAR40_15375 [Candidatus Sabulitectum sp.]|nr:hypothetical protein [Candidatus Sabulitectum sp.]